MKKIIFCILCGILCASTMLSASSVAYAQEKPQFANFNNKSYVLIDKNSGEVLLDKNSNQKMQVASICKLMTTLITLENIDESKLTMDDMLRASEHACSMEGSQAFLDAGSEYKVSELLKSVIVASANDSAVVLAEHIGGDEVSFVKLMNEKAKELGMKNTIYANATGLPAPNQYSTAYDTTLILAQLNKYEAYKNDCKIWMDDFVHPSGRVTQLVNTNRLVKYYSPCVSGKTGFTDEAGYCLSACASKNNMDLIAVVLGCKDSASRFSECMTLLNYGFDHYEIKNVVEKNAVLEQKVKVLRGKEKEIWLIYQEDFAVLKEKGNNNQIDVNIQLPETVIAPICQGDVVGKAIISKDGVVVGEVNIVALSTVEKQTYKDAINRIGNYWGIA